MSEFTDDQLARYKLAYAQVLAKLIAKELETRALLEDNDALVQLVGVLMQPRDTDAQVRARRDALLQIQGMRVH